MSENNQIVPGVVAGSTNSTKGLWVSEGNQTIGLVEQDGVGGYLTIYSDTTKRGLPLAITYEGIQLPQSDNCSPVRFISWDDLYNLVQASK